MRQINRFLKLQINKKKGTMSILKGPNFTFTAKKRKDLRMGLRCIMTPIDDPIIIKQGNKICKIKI